MTVALWCVLFGGLLPIFCAGIAKAGAGDFDNAKPREWLDRLEGWRKRADAAQRNGFEAFPLFAVAVLVAQTQGVPQSKIDWLAIVWVVCRAGYVAAYLANRALLRSFLFACAFSATILIFLSPLVK